MKAFLSMPDTLEQIQIELGKLRRELALIREVMPPTLVSVTEAAERLGVRPKTIRKRVQDGTLRHIKLGGQIRIDLASVTAALAG